MMERRLLRQLEAAARRLRQLRLWLVLALTWLATALAGVVILVLNWSTGWYWEHAVPALLLGSLASALIGGWLALRSARDYHLVAQRVEAVYPELRSCLLAAIEQRPELPGGRYGFLQDRVIRQALKHGYRHTWRQVVPAGRLLAAHAAHLAAFLLCAGVIASVVLYAAPRPNTAAAPDELLSIVSGRFRFTIEPGNAEVERGTSLLVLARFNGPLPPEAMLVYQPTEGDPRRLPMSKSLDDPIFGGRIAVVDRESTYRVEFAGQQSDTYHVTVFEFPRLQRADARLVFPDYTALEETLVQDVRQVTAVEGTKLKWICYLNKAVREARLVEKDGRSIELLAEEGDQSAYAATITLDKTRRFQLRLVDPQGRKNKLPAELVVNVVPNKAPDLKLALPARDVQVSPLEELQLQANVWDDYGLNRYGVSYTLAGSPPRETVLGESMPGKQRVNIDYLLEFEALEAQPDQLLSYHFWAEDTGPQGESRRTSSDMYFAEVRHFEEIFRQGQQPPGGAAQQQQQGGNAQAAQKLAELQKEIINATWKVIRRETAAAPSTEYAGDVQLLLQSQMTALEQVDELSQRIQDDASIGHVQTVREQMLEAVEQLSRAKDGPAIDPLQPALAAEQSAYQALLKLRAREHAVRRSQGQSSAAGSGSSSGRAQQQLQQLELKNDENRYETQRTAQTQQQQADRETRQILSRLRELARRQGDLNKRLKELQSALEEARSQEEKDEIRRQLKRLREEQQQMLRDIDELKARMERPENLERMQEAGQQLERTRENVRRASEALQEGRVSRAVAAGTRAERELEDLREEFRKQASGRFSEEMRHMREQAQQLDKNQQEVGRQLAELDQPAKPNTSLRDTGQRDRIEQELQQQKQRLEDLLSEMRRTIEEAEQAEPLLAEQLYDTVRKTQQQNLQRALDSTQRSLRRGLVQDARNEERVAGRGIGELREGVERAAESVLGDETEGLRRAHQELQQLAEQLQQEIQRESGAEPSPSDPRENDQQPDRPRPGAPQQASAAASGENQQASSAESSNDQSPPRQSSPPSRPASEPQASPNSQDPSSQRPTAEPGSRDSQRPGDRSPGQPSAARQPSASPANRQGGPRNAAATDGLGGLEQFLTDPGNLSAPLSGDDFLDWSDRLRDVEEMIGDPELRGEAARIRDRARGIRIDVKRRSKPPNWDLVRLQVLKPLAELRDRVAEELLRRSSKEALVPIDRDPVPPEYAEPVRRYYERLGSGR